MNKDWIAVIPAYEPENYLIQLLQDLTQAGFSIIVIDDGSGKTFASIFQEASKYAIILHHSKNAGKGRALKTGFSYIQENLPTNSIIVTLDADGQHTVEDARKICFAAMKQPDHLILGSRALQTSVPLRSRLGNGITRHVYAISTGLHVHDTQTGLRAFHGSLLPQFLKITGERYEYEMNVLLECTRLGIQIQEVEISTIYFNKNATSHFNTVKDSYRVYLEILRFSASSLLSFLIDYGLYTIFSLITIQLQISESVWISNICARIISASANYMLNRKLVFQSKTSFAKSAIQYFLLAACILLGNTLVLEGLTDILGWNRYFAKICTELLFFLISWVVQHSLIFKRNKK